jgi:hypothetical protein
MSTTLYREVARPQLHPNNVDVAVYTGGVATGGSLLWVIDAQHRVEALARSADVDLGQLASLEPSFVTYTANTVNRIFEIDYDSYWDRIECLHFAPFHLLTAGEVIQRAAEGDVIAYGANVVGSVRPQTVVIHDQPQAHLLVPSVEALREKEPAAATKRAVAATTKAIHDLLPELSETELGSLVGVTRQAWREWSAGKSLARSKRRRRLYRLRRLLELRQALAPDESLALWIESPVSTRDSRTPAELLAAGREDLVAALAASQTVDDVADRFEVEPIDFGVPVDRGEAANGLQAAREIARGDISSQD